MRKNHSGNFGDGSRTREHVKKLYVNDVGRDLRLIELASYDTAMGESGYSYCPGNVFRNANDGDSQMLAVMFLRERLLMSNV